jgi:tetratricopeptide (TPR) repeat protein
MAKKRRGLEDDLGDTTLDRIDRVLEQWPAGLHDLGEPARDLPLDWPTQLVDVYMTWNGARLFSEAIELVPASDVERTDDRWIIGSAWGDEITVDREGRVWRHDADADAPVLDGTSLPRWLSGAIDAEGLLFDKDGEFAEDVFDEEGELLEAVELARLRARVKRDPKAPGPRWALARRLRRAGQVDEARDHLEQVVASAPVPWAWLDLARISEELGDAKNAIEEAVSAAEAARGDDQEAFFWAHAARLAAIAGDDARRAQLAARAKDADPGVVAAFVSGATENLTSEELEGARMLVELAKAIAPRDLSVLDLAKKL